MIVWNYFIAMLALVLIIVGNDAQSHERSVLDANFSKSPAQKKTLVFVSGWPQSGTSLIHHMLSSADDISSMIEKCNLLLGPQCYNFNHEGQWLLKPEMSTFFGSGKMCPYPRTPYNKTHVSESMLSQWSRYWDLQRSIFLEKSPQSMLKIPLLYDLFADQYDIKFIVIIKHPVTLNIALMKNHEWMTHSTGRGKSKEVYHSNMSTIISNVHHFINFMTKDISSNVSCELGWLEGMHQFHQQLGMMPTHITDTIRIVRYESFLKPVSTCYKIFEFIYNDSTRVDSANKQICIPYFSSSDKDKGNPTHPAIIRQRDIHQKYNKQSMIGSRALHDIPAIDRTLRSRSLRLKRSQGEGENHFSLEIVKKSLNDRMRDFEAVFRRIDPKLRRLLQDIEQKLKPYGYKLRDSYASFHTHTSLLSRWELIQ